VARIEWFFELEDAYGQKWELLKPTGGLYQMTGAGLPTATTGSQKTPTQHGSTRTGFVLNDREIVAGISYEGAFVGPYGKSPLMERRERGPYKVLGYLSGACILRAWRKDGAVRELRRTWYAGGLEGDSEFVHDDFEEVSVLLKGKDPPWYDPDSHTITSVYDDFDHGVYASTLTLNSTDGLVTNGDWYTYPTITINGPCTDFDIENVTLTVEQRLRFTKDLIAGESVTLVCNPHPAFLSAEDGDGADVEGYIPPGDIFGGFQIVPHPVATNGNNTWELTVQGIDANSSFVFTWEDRYQGL
jgi:hypothetical protein